MPGAVLRHKVKPHAPVYPTLREVQEALDANEAATTAKGIADASTSGVGLVRGGRGVLQER